MKMMSENAVVDENKILCEEYQFQIILEAMSLFVWFVNLLLFIQHQTLSQSLNLFVIKVFVLGFIPLHMATMLKMWK